MFVLIHENHSGKQEVFFFFCKSINCIFTTGRTKSYKCNADSLSEETPDKSHSETVPIKFNHRGHTCVVVL